MGLGEAVGVADGDGLGFEDVIGDGVGLEVASGIAIALAGLGVTVSRGEALGTGLEEGRAADEIVLNVR
jgi:hypothetical protein